MSSVEVMMGSEPPYTLVIRTVRHCRKCEFVLPGNEPEENYFNKLQDDIKMSSSVQYCTINVVLSIENVK